jgi:hypothetical protein
LTAILTESSAVCDLAVEYKSTVNSMRKYFMLIDFKILWQMNWLINALVFYYFNTKIKSLIMQTMRILQVVALMLIVALAASCATSNQYVSKLFGPRPVKDSQTVAIKFLELDSLEAGEQWVKTDITKDKDSSGEAKTTPVVTESKTTQLPSEPVAKTNNPDGTRTKKTRE